MVMALDTANFFIRDLGALRFGTAATRSLLIPWQLPDSCKAGKGDTDIRKKAQSCVEGAVEEAMEERVFQSQSRNQVVFVRIRKGAVRVCGQRLLLPCR